jgi:transcriptional regulator with XRE-family HTH domain
LVTELRSSVAKDVSLAALLKRHRAASGLTQEELAERAGVSARTISDTERGLRTTVYRDTVERLAAALGLEAEARGKF